MKKANSAPHVELLGSHVEEKARIDCMVSKEVKKMWHEITENDRRFSSERYYPAHTLERMIRAEYQVMKTFGIQGGRKK
ncbi:hypothetical protein ENFAE_25540 [Enterococcus faecalis]|uniref:hypothetical protein n=1 Tax=Enterococcus faecalis TaxID=1351 RepID=UPI0008780D8D|nr:hypothetical protein [Enterococcus faecalis]EGO8395702.1 hypothetical protein [Enterococcus faecalis]OFA10999.1 hypothetical protein ENFAE_25540 [Enterococcus faecalis]